jgi:Ankyrin repeats (3 copies)
MMTRTKRQNERLCLQQSALDSMQEDESTPSDTAKAVNPPQYLPPANDRPLGRRRWSSDVLFASALNLVELDEFNDASSSSFHTSGAVESPLHAFHRSSSIQDDLHRYLSCVDLLALQEQVGKPQDVRSDEEMADLWSLWRLNDNNFHSILYHDILMHIFTFLDIDSLAAMSSTARRLNFECFYYLQLSLQQAISGNNCFSSSLEGYGILSRLSKIDGTAAQQILQTYLDSNRSLPTLPLPHRLAYWRQLMHATPATTSPTTAAIATALLMVGAASFMNADEMVSDGGLPSWVLGVFGSLAAARAAVQKLSPPAPHAVQSSSAASAPLTPNHEGLHSPDPYVHVPSQALEVTNPGGPAITELATATFPEQQLQLPTLKVPSGCVGAYLRAVANAHHQMTAWVQAERRHRYQSLDPVRRRQVEVAFLEACAADDYATVLNLVQEQATVDVDGFFATSVEGIVSCGLHQAALHGASRVVEFLCRGIHDTDDADDGGCCTVNLQDANGWTALHYAVGANRVDAIHALLRCGASPDVEAANGYTPGTWATRLQNHNVARLLHSHRDHHGNRATGQDWTPLRPLATAASRFWALIPPLPSRS